MTLWMVVTLAFSAFLALCGALAERGVAACGVPRRFVWIIFVGLALAIPSIGGFGVQHVIQRSAGRAPARVTERPSGSTFASAPAADVSILMSASATRRRNATVVAYTRYVDVVMMIVWSITSLLLLVRLFAALHSLRRVTSDWKKVRVDGYSVWLSANAGPAVVSFVRPRIVIPRWLLDEDEQTREMLLRHELEHVRAGDARVLLGAAVVDAVIPWNLPVRWMLRRLRLALEIDCDRRVVRSVGSVGRYGLALVRVGERHASRLPAAACFLDSPLGLEVRIRAMSIRSRRRPIVGACCVAAMMFVATIAGAWTPWPTARRTRVLENMRVDRDPAITTALAASRSSSTKISEKPVKIPCRSLRSASAILASPIIGATACLAPRPQPSDTSARVGTVVRPAIDRPSVNDSLKTLIPARAIDATRFLKLLPVSDSVLRRAASAVYENADAAQRGSGATIWILAESSGNVIAGTVVPPAGDTTTTRSRARLENGPYSFAETVRLFPQTAVARRGLEFALIRSRMVLQSDTVTAVWAQLLSESSQ